MARNCRRANGILKGAIFALLTQASLVSAQVAEIEKASNDSLLWGPYRPNLYFGVRPRIPKSLMGGLLWTKVEDHSVQNSEYLAYCCACGVTK
jgi:mannosyl-oligosaccharide glucosidase